LLRRIVDLVRLLEPGLGIVDSMARNTIWPLPF
jgi:hypothetical protein